MNEYIPITYTGYEKNHYCAYCILNKYGSMSFAICHSLTMISAALNVCSPRYKTQLKF